ncbi:MAG: hypothetical protein PHO92_02230 [Candidatus Peribacteraceae bacterium]|nr:hypothetical protein [Candidatus Peribacteraceae bacterium]
MEHTHNQFRQATGEHRLCPLNAPRQLGEAYESLQSSDRMRANPDLKAVIELYDNMFLKAEFAEMCNPLDRAYFYALLYDGIIRVGGTKYEDVKRSDLNVSDPMRLAGKPAAEAVKIIRESLPQLLEQLTANGAATDEEILQAYKDRIALTDMRWREGKVPDDDQLLEAPFLHYKAVKARVDGALRKYGILVPGTEARSALASYAGRPRLSRDEYLLLLKLAWGNPAAAQQEIENRRDVQKVQQWLGRERGKPDNKRVQQLYTDFSAVEVSPQEALAGFGVQVGEMARGAYISRMMASQHPNVPVDPNAAQEKFVSAAAWENDPAQAYRFLSDPEVGFPGTARNGAFLTGLRYWFIEQRGSVPAMSKEDTLAILRLVVQELVAAEAVVRSSLDQREGLRKKITGAEKLEDIGAGVWEYMKEFRDHPVGSAAMWLVAFMAVKSIIKFVKGDSNNFVKYGFWIGMSGLAAGLYQQHTKGEAWWEGLWGRAQGWFGKEAKLEPKEQTLPNYWAQMLGKEQGKDDLLSPEKERLCISILQTQNTKSVLEWYRQKRTSAPGTRVPLPFTIDFKLRQQFGRNADIKGIEELMHRSLQRILSNRGKVARQEQLLLNVPNQISSGDEDIGYQYLMERYVERKYYEAILVHTLEVVRAEFNEEKIDHKDPQAVANVLNNPRMQQPDMKNLRLMLQNAFIFYQREAREVSTADCPLWYVLLTESDPEIMRRMNTRAGEGAGLIDELYKNASELSIREEWYKRTWGVEPHMVKSFMEKVDAFGKVAGKDAEVGPEKRGQTVRIYMPSGVLGYGAGKYGLEVSFQEFLTSSPVQLIEKWKQHAFEQKRTEIENDAASRDIYEFLTPARAGDTVSLGNPAYKFYPGWQLSTMDFLRREIKDFDVALKNDPKLQLTAKFIGAGPARKIEIRARAVAGGYPTEFAVDAIKDKTVDEVEEMWLQIQATRIEREVRALPERVPNYPDPDFVFSYDAARQEVVFGGKDPVTDRTIKASLYDMVKYPTPELFKRYHDWVVAGRNPAVNPF